MTVEERVMAILVERLGVDEKEVKPDALLVDDLGANSLDLVEVVMALEEEFDFNVPDEDAEGIGTFADVVAYVKMKTAAAQES